MAQNHEQIEQINDDKRSQPSAFSKLFLAQIELPLNLVMVRNAVACATQISEILSFSKSDRFDLELAVEEAFCNSVKHFSRVADSNDRIYVEFFIETDALVVSIRENGIPFNLEQADKYTPDSLEGMNAPGLGMLLMNKGMDSVELFVHGRKGKEVRLTKRLRYGAIPEALFPTVSRKDVKKRALVINPILRLATEDDLEGIRRLAWRCYGYTQEALLYDLDLLTEKFLSGELKSLVVFDPASENMIGHIALKYHDPTVKVAEISLAFIDSSYKCPGLSAKMAQTILKISRDHGDLGAFDCSVTTHIYSQKLAQDSIGSMPCSILMGIAAKGMRVQNRPTARQEKGTVINHYNVFDHSKRMVYVPLHHKKMISEIYQWLNLPRSFGKPNLAVPTGESSVQVFSLPDELNVAFIVVHKIGEDTAKAVISGLRRCKKERKDAVYAFLPLGVAASPYLVERCEKIGLSFAGIMPHIHDGDDRLLMQYVNVDVDPASIRLYGEKSAKLFSYILNEQKRIDNLAIL